MLNYFPIYQLQSILRCRCVVNRGAVVFHSHSHKKWNNTPRVQHLLNEHSSENKNGMNYLTSFFTGICFGSGSYAIWIKTSEYPPIWRSASYESWPRGRKGFNRLGLIANGLKPGLFPWKKHPGRFPRRCAWNIGWWCRPQLTFSYLSTRSLRLWCYRTQ